MHQKSKWFKDIGFLATELSTFVNEQSKNFTHRECEEHFYPKDSLSTTDVHTFAALKLLDFGGLLSICFLMVGESHASDKFVFINVQRSSLHIRNLLVEDTFLT